MKKKVLLLLISCFLFPFCVKAEDYKMDLSCDPVVAKDDIMTCKMRVLSGDMVFHQISGILPSSSDFQLLNFESGPMNCTSTSKTFECTSEAGIKAPNIIFSFSSKVVHEGDYQKETETLETTISKINEETVGQLIESNKIVFDKMHQSKLTNLSVRGEKLYPTFDSNIFHYELTTTSDSVTISGTLQDASSTVNIKNLSSHTVKLSYGANPISIKVTAKDGTKSTYVITAVREDHRSDDNKLQLLSVNGEQILLEENKYNYEIEVESNVAKPNILYAASNSSSTIDMIGPKELNVGNNQYIINVTSEKGNTLQYVLVIKRKAEVKSEDTKLKKLKIKNVDSSISFDMDVTSYDLHLPKKVSTLDLEVEVNDPKSTYEIIGNENLKNNSRVQIKVTAENGKVGTYSIFIQKDSTNYMPFIIGTLIFLCLVGAGVFIYLLKKKKEKEIESYLDDTIVMKHAKEDELGDTIVVKKDE